MMTVAARLHREAFRTSSVLDFCSTRELVKQIRHPIEQWLLIILKELVHNALDATEDAKIAPAIQIEVCNNQIAVRGSDQDGRRNRPRCLMSSATTKLLSPLSYLYHGRERTAGEAK